MSVCFRSRSPLVCELATHALAWQSNQLPLILMSDQDETNCGMLPDVESSGSTTWQDLGRWTWNWSHKHRCWFWRPRRWRTCVARRRCSFLPALLDATLEQSAAVMGVGRATVPGYQARLRKRLEQSAQPPPKWGARRRASMSEWGDRGQARTILKAWARKPDELQSVRDINAHALAKGSRVE